jgi:hypothetical protein
MIFEYSADQSSEKENIGPYKQDNGKDNSLVLIEIVALQPRLGRTYPVDRSHDVQRFSIVPDQPNEG